MSRCVFLVAHDLFKMYWLYFFLGLFFSALSIMVLKAAQQMPIKGGKKWVLLLQKSGLEGCGGIRIVAGALHLIVNRGWSLLSDCDFHQIYVASFHDSTLIFTIFGVGRFVITIYRAIGQDHYVLMFCNRIGRQWLIVLFEGRSATENAAACLRG